MFDAGRTRMIGLPYGEKNYGNILSRFHLIPERNGQTDGQTDGRTDRFAISISRVSMLTRDKNVSMCMSTMDVACDENNKFSSTKNTDIRKQSITT